VNPSGAYLHTAWPRVLAHRGLAVSAPENTLLAFQRALDVGATHLETDVHTSSDGVAVISHDPDLERLLGRRVRVRDLTAEQLLDIDLGHGQSFCTLEDALRTFPQARFNIDIKDAASIRSAAETIRSARALERVLVTSFSERRRSQTTALLPGVASSASAGTVLRLVLSVRTGRTAAIPRLLSEVVAIQVPEYSGRLRVLTPRLIEAVHAASVEVHVWTVNEPADMTRLLAMGVDGLVTDRADLAAEVLRRS
jgi:glycerophosphoryl diester phosphodiesterase